MSRCEDEKEEDEKVRYRPPLLEEPCAQTLSGKRICKDRFRLAGAVQESYSSEMLGGQGANFLRWVVFWSIKYVDFLR